MQGRVAEMRSAARALEQFKAQINVYQKQNSAYCAGKMKKDPKGSFFRLIYVVMRTDIQKINIVFIENISDTIAGIY